MPLASDVMNLSASLLNDRLKLQFSFAQQLPMLQLAYRDLKERLLLDDIPVIEDRSDIVTVLANAIEINPLPSGLIRPIYLEERQPGESEDAFIPMDEKSWEPSITRVSVLRYWSWRELKINLVGATVNREVRIRFQKNLGDISGESSNIVLDGADNFLIKMTASYCARYIGENPTRADSLEIQALKSLDQITRADIKKQQGTPSKRKPFWNHRRTSWQRR